MIMDGQTGAVCQFNRFSDLDAPDHPGCHADDGGLPYRWGVRNDAAEAGRCFGNDDADLSIEPFDCAMDKRYPAFPCSISQQEPGRITIEPVDDQINAAD